MGTALLPDNDECCDETPVPVDGVFDLELGLEVRSVSDTMPPPPAPGGIGDRAGLERCDICDSERGYGGSDDSEVFRACAAVLWARWDCAACADAMSPWLFIFAGEGVGVGRPVPREFASASGRAGRRAFEGAPWLDLGFVAGCAPTA